MGSQQDVIDKLIDYIDAAVLKNSVSNRQVAAVLAFLNDGLKNKTVNIEELAKVFLRKDQPEQTDHLFKAFGGLEIGSFIHGMNEGRGAAIDALGNLEAESGTFRSSLRVLELIYNGLSVTNDKSIWSAGGTIERIEQQDSAYLCYIRKDSDTDVVKFKVDDILLGNYNQTGGFVNSYMRVINVDVAANTIVVVPGADESVPSGQNYPPCELMVLARTGNFTDKSRQNSIYLDAESLQFCMLSGVDSFIISPLCKKGFMGVIDSPAELGLPADTPIQKGDMVGFFDKLFAKNFFTVDRKGQIVKQEIDRGAWVANPVDDAGTPWPYEMTDAEVDCCWYLNCKWKCIVPIATNGVPPSSTSSEWLLITGDTTLSMTINSTNGWAFRPTQVDTTLVATVKRGMEDITQNILDSDWEWRRDSKHPASDTSWNAAHTTTTSQLAITSEDMGPNWLSSRKVKFTAIAYVRVGEQVKQIYNEKIVRL